MHAFIIACEVIAAVSWLLILGYALQFVFYKLMGRWL